MVRDKLAAMRKLLLERFPDDPRHTLDVMTSSWRNYLDAFDKVELDGRLKSESGAERQVFQLAYTDPRYARRHERLVVERLDGAWKVSSFGEATPAGRRLGAQRTRVRFIERAWPQFLEAMDSAEKPVRSIMQAARRWEEIVQQVAKQLVGGETGGGQGRVGR